MAYSHLHNQEGIPDQQKFTVENKYTVYDPRLLSLDVLRGMALLGILLVSIWEFGGFSQNQQTGLRLMPHGGNYKLMAAVYLLIEGKMRAIFSLVFGAGMIIYLSRTNQSSTLKTPDLFIRRQLWLLLFGIFNAILLLWPGDILFQYGVMGILLYPFWRMKPKGLFIAALLVTLIYCGKMYWNYSDDKKAYKKYKAVVAVEKKFDEKKKKDSIAAAKTAKPLSQVTTGDTSKLKKDTLAKKLNKDTLTKQQAEDKGKWEGIVKSLKYDSTADAKENKAMQKISYSKIYDHLIRRSQFKEAAWLYQTGIWDISSLMFLGMALLGIGFFGNRFTIKQYILLGLLALIAGLALSWLRLYWQNLKLTDYEKYINSHAVSPGFFFPVERLVMAVGYAALIMAALRWKILNWLWHSLAAVGKMAFTNYLAQTIICTLIFYGYGMGYFGRLPQWQLYFIVMEIWLVQIVFSVWWLRHYNTGPMEWVWRSLVHWKKQPIKKMKTDENPGDSSPSFTPSH